MINWSKHTFYNIGSLGKPHGINGEILFYYTDDIFDRRDEEWLALDIDGIKVPFFIEGCRFKNDEIAIIKFVDIDSKEAVSRLTSTGVYVPYSWIDSEEEVSYSALIGFSIIDTNTNKLLGELLSVDDSTINILFEIKYRDENILIPASDELIEYIDIEGKTIGIKIVEGLI